MTQTKTEYIIRKLLFASVLLLLVGCQRETFEWMDDNRPNPDGSMRFSLKTEDAEKETDQLQTRGTPRESLEEYNTVSVDVFSHTSDYTTSGDDVKFLRNVLLQQKESKWEYTPSLFWPEGKKLSFIAYASDIPFAKAGITFSSEEEPDRINYQVPDSVTLQPDLLVSTKFNQTKVNNVTLTMKHALACVSFCGIAPEGGTYVKSITLRNVCSEGTLALKDPSIKWIADPDSKGTTIFEAGINIDQELGKDPLKDNNYLMTENGYLMMIPQNLKDAGAAIDVLYWNKKDDTGNKVITYILPVDKEDYATWQPGKKYIYKFGNQSSEDITVVYYEKYADGYGLYYNSKGTSINTLNDKEILEAGYGVLSTEDAGSNQVPIRLATASSSAVNSGTFVTLPEGFLYPVSQSGGNTFPLSASSTPVDVYFNNSNKSCGMILPHFAKGVYTVKTVTTRHDIRTPQQMRNITALGKSSTRGYHIYTQELDLDFSKADIGGGLLTTSVVACEFNDVFNGQKKRIENVTINATNANGALFYSNSGAINEVWLLNSSISSSGNTGGIAATNVLGGVIYHPRIIGEKNKIVDVQGSSGYVGAIVGLNYGTITGNNIDEEKATELPVAEVSGWVSIKGGSQPVGGIAGQNNGTITTCLVNGVHVSGPNASDVEIAKITIEGGSYVGGIVGVNRNMVKGNYSDKGAEPDVAGLVSITGTGNWVGGIAGENSGTLNQVNVRLGRGKDATEGTTITGKQSVGGIVGYNNGGTLTAADGNSKSFISVRGNVTITGTMHVGGIVGNNGSGDISDCFVYNFYNQKGTVHYAPKIIGDENVGGIVGYAGTGTIKQCAIFSTVSSENDAGDDVTNAVASVEARISSAGGIVGHGFTGLTITESFVLGNVKINGKANSGGIVGENETGTTITKAHIGNSGTAVTNIYNDLFKKIGLPVYDDRMNTGGATGIMTRTSGTPTIEGTTYVGGICGVNWGKVEVVEIKDNVNIGTSSSTFVGGIAGGNGIGAIINGCKTYNPSVANSEVIIEGAKQVGGIVGVNNGIVDQCQLGMPNIDASRLITIKGVSGVGGIAGTNGGHRDHLFDVEKPKEKGTGDDNTCIKNCNVYGKVLIEATADRVGGIIGENGFTNKVIDCKVIGYTSSYRSADDYSYDITLKGEPNIGGIAGINYGDIHGTSLGGCMVTHTAVVGNGHAGGLVGSIKSRKARLDINEYQYEAMLYNCDVSRGVLIYQWETSTGAFAGQIDGVRASETNQTLFGTASSGPTNKIYIGTIDPVRISRFNTVIKYPPLIENLPVYGPRPSGDPIPLPDPDKRGNLWADYQLWNYLYYSTYQ